MQLDLPSNQPIENLVNFEKFNIEIKKNYMFLHADLDFILIIG